MTKLRKRLEAHAANHPELLKARKNLEIVAKVYDPATVARWNTQKSGKLRRDMINRARRYVANHEGTSYQRNIRVVYNGYGSVVGWGFVEK